MKGGGGRAAPGKAPARPERASGSERVERAPASAPAGAPAKPIDALAFLPRIPKHTPLPVYALTGDETFFRDRVVAALRARLLGADAPASAVQAVAGKRAAGEAPTTLDALLRDLRTGSLFETTRLVRVADAKALLEGGGDALLAYLDAPAAGVHLVLECEGLDGRTRLAKRLASAGAVIECRRPFDHPPPWQADAPPWDHPLAAWLVTEARDQGLTMGKPAAHALTERVGGEPGLLAREVERLASVVGGTPAKPKAITEKEIAALVVDSRGEDLFRLGDAIARRDAAAALKIVDALFRDGVPQQRGDRARDPGFVSVRVVGWIHRTLRELWVSRALGDRRADAGEVARTLGKKPVFAEALLRDAQRFRPAEFARWWPRLLATDVALKTGAPARLAVETLILELFGKAGDPARPRAASGAGG